MATTSKDFWANFFGLPQENESYIPYIFSLKFLWAPLVSTVSFILDNLIYFLGRSGASSIGSAIPVVVDLPNTDLAIPICLLSYPRLEKP